MPQASAGNNIYDPAQLANNTVLSTKIKDGEIVNADINAGAGILATKVQELSVGANGGVLPSTGVANGHIAANAAIADTKLAEIGTANKVNATAIKNLAGLPAAAGVVPNANLPTQGITLIGADNGTSNDTNACVLDSFNITGLTKNDRLMIMFSVSAAGAGGGAGGFYSVTDSKYFIKWAQPGNIGSGASVGGMVILQNERQNLKDVYSNLINPTSQTNTAAETTAAGNTLNNSSDFATDWTGNWELALRSDGVSAGATIHWSWAIFKMAGQ